MGVGAGGLEAVTKYNDQGFPTVVTEPAAAATAAKHYDEKGFLITSSPASGARPTGPLVAAASALAQPTTEDVFSSASTTSHRAANFFAFLVAGACGHLAAALAY